ncbi:hypothetical protein DFJ74DRAFT_708312 [Hyaloraphidium curvatum]|nr:hypothetical protein DFJ74DRAFT_708312 [Hyaloraphidium curvatum]
MPFEKLSRLSAAMQPAMLAEAEKYKAQHQSTSDASGRDGPRFPEVHSVVKRVRDRHRAFRPDESRWPEIPKDVLTLLLKHAPGTGAAFVIAPGPESRLKTWYTAISVKAVPGERSGWSEFGDAVLAGETGMVRALVDELEAAEGPETTAKFLSMGTEWSFGQSYVALANLGKKLFSHFGRPPAEHVGVIQELAKRGANVNHQDFFGYTALFQSLINNPLLDVAEALLSLGADINVQNIFGTTVLTSCIMAGDDRTASWVLDHGASVNHGIPPPSAVASRIPRMSALLASHERKKQKEAARKQGLVRCDVCAKSADDVDLKRCARCHGPYYCSTACQKEAWPSHKADCAAKAAENAEEIELRVMDLGSNVMMKIPNALLGGYDRPDEKPAKKPASGKPFVVKAQIQLVVTPQGRHPKPPEDGDTITVYDASRTVECLLQRRGQVEPWQRLYDTVLDKGVDRAKAYFNATLAEGDPKRLRIQVGTVLKPQKW